MTNLPISEIAKHEHGRFWADFSGQEQDAITICAIAWRSRERAGQRAIEIATGAILREENRAIERSEAAAARGRRPQPSPEALAATADAKKADAARRNEREEFRAACRAAGLTAPMSQACRAHLLGMWRRTGKIEL